MPFPIEYLLTSEVTLKSLFPPPLKCKHSLWQLLLTFHLEDNKSYFRKCGKNRWLHWCFAASKVSCQEHQNLQTFKTLLLSSPHPRKTFNFKFQLRFSSNGFQLKLSHWKIGKKMWIDWPQSFTFRPIELFSVLDQNEDVFHSESVHCCPCHLNSEGVCPNLINTWFAAAGTLLPRVP